MCGRFTLRSPVESLRQVYGLSDLPGIRPRYNIAPTQPVPVIRQTGDERHLEQLRWGLVPHWADDPSIGNRMINARAETAADKPAFRDAFRERRCLIAADGFYEWQRLGDRKQPWYLSLESESPFAFAGIWERWREPGRGAKLESCAILTTEPNELVEPIHDRMPVVLLGKDIDRWLSPDSTRDELEGLLGPIEAEHMKAVPVSTRVNDPANEGPDCIRPVEPPADPAPANGRLF